MMLHYGLPQPLRIYETRQHQNRYRKGSSGNVFDLLCPTDWLLPFQIAQPLGGSFITAVNAVPVGGGTPIALLPRTAAGQFGQFERADIQAEYLVHFGSAPLSQHLPEGRYDLEIVAGANTWYSEVITFKRFGAYALSDCVPTKITYFATCNIDSLFYKTTAEGAEQYKNVLYLDVEVGKPEYATDEEGEQDGSGAFSFDRVTLRKRYAVQSVVPEYIADALAMLPLHQGAAGSIEITTNRGYSAKIKELAVNTEWEDEFGVWATSQIDFVTHLIQKTGCCGSPTGVTSCVRLARPFAATVNAGSADYTNFRYTSLEAGIGTVSLVENDEVMVFLGAGEEAWRLDRFTGAGYTPVNTAAFTQGYGAVDLNRLNNGAPSSPYSIWSTAIGWVTEPTFNLTFNPDTGNYLVSGLTWANSIVEIRGVYADGSTVLIDTGTGEAYNSEGIVFTPPLMAVAVFVRFLGVNCTLATSAEALIADAGLPGIGVMEIGTTFEIS